MNDLQIIELYLARNEQAIKETEMKYGRLCFSISNNILNNVQDSKECVNDTYLALWNKIPPEQPKSFMAFVAKIARNTALKKVEYNTADKRNSQMTMSLDEIQDIALDENIKDNISAEELGKLINKFLKAEKTAARNVFIRRYFYFDSVTDIAERYSFSESKVKSMLFQSRKRLKKFLHQEGIYV